MTEETVRRGPGRPRKNPAVERESARPSKREWKMTESPNWENIDPSEESSPDRLKINPDMIPEGMALQWVTSSVFGQPTPQHQQTFKKGGWTPVHQADFDGQFDGMFMQKGVSGEITVDGLVLMARPVEMNIRAKKLENQRAREQLSIKEQALRGGDLPVSLDSRHSSALQTNRISKSIERIEIPKD